MGCKRIAAIVVWVSALLTWTSCQKGSSPGATYVEHGPPRYEITCPVGERCEESVALLVGLSAPEEPMRCTAALVGERTAITAGHCVDWELSSGGSCGDVWLGFAGHDGETTEWVGCSAIEAVASSGVDLLSPDYAILKLQASVARRPYPIEMEPVVSGDVVRMVSVTADRFYDERHEVRSRRCVVDENGSLAPFGPEAPDSIRVLSSCPIREGSSGSPVLDTAGRMRGLIHGGGPRYFAFGLMTLLPEPVEGEGG